MAQTPWGRPDPDKELPVFEYILGIPAHPLFVHFAIVFLVLLVTGAAVYALVPPLRGRIWWAVAGLAVIGPLCAYFAKESGSHLLDMLIAQKYPKEIIDQVNVHMGYGTTTFNYSLGLGAATLVLVLLSLMATRGRREAIPAEREDDHENGAVAAKAPRTVTFATIGMSLVVLVLAGVTGYYVFKTGDAGSHAVWGSFIKP